MRLMDASSALRLLDGGTGGRVLSFSRAETARPTGNQGGGRPCDVLEAGAAVSSRSAAAHCHIRRHYDVNGGTEVAALSDQSVSSSLRLLAPDYYRTGYGFAGWNTKADGTGTSYGPMETIDASSMGHHPLCPLDRVRGYHPKLVRLF